MTEKQFNEIVQRAAHPPFGVPSQVKQDMGDLLSEIARRATAGDTAFEPEPKTDEEIAAEEAAEAEAAPKKGGKKR